MSSWHKSNETGSSAALAIEAEQRRLEDIVIYVVADFKLWRGGKGADFENISSRFIQVAEIGNFNRVPRVDYVDCIGRQSGSGRRLARW